MSDISIKKVKLVKLGEKLEIAFHETGNINAAVDKVCDNPCHQDLKKAIARLACHLAIQTDYLTEKQAMDKDELEKFEVTGYSIGGKEDGEGVVITGYRKTRSGRTVTLNTPFLKLDSEPETYYLIKDLNSAIELIEGEVGLYLEGKKAPDAQGEIEFPEDEPITNVKIDHPEQEYSENGGTVVNMDSEKKKGKKKVAQTAESPNGEIG